MALEGDKKEDEEGFRSVSHLRPDHQSAVLVDRIGKFLWGERSGEGWEERGEVDGHP